MVGWHPQFNGHEFEQTLGDGERQRSLACGSPWGGKEWDTTQLLNNTILNNPLVNRVSDYTLALVLLDTKFYRSVKRPVF